MEKDDNDKDVVSFSHREVKMSSMIIAIVITAIVVGAAVGLVVNSMNSNNTKTTTTTSSGKTVITFSDALAGSEYNYVNNTVIPNFEKAYSNITVKFITESPTQVINTVQSEAASGNVQINVVGSDNSYMGALVSTNTIIPLNKYMNKFEPMNSSSTYTSSASGTIIPAYYKEGYFSGTYYFMPWRGNVQLAFYNQSAFTKAGANLAPTNASNLLYDMQQLNSHGFAKPFNMQGHGGASTPTQVFQWMAEFGGNPMYLNDTGDIAALTYLQKMMDMGLMSNANSTGYWGTYKSLGATYQYIDQWPYVQSLLTSTYNWANDSSNAHHNLGINTVFKGPGNRAQYVVGGDVLGIVNGSKNKWASIDFMNYLDSAAVQKGLLLNLTWPVVNTYAYKNLPSNISNTFSFIKYEELNGIFRPAVPWIGQWQNYFDVAWAEIMSQNDNVTSALNQAHASLAHYLGIYYSGELASYQAGHIYPSGNYLGPKSE